MNKVFSIVRNSRGQLVVANEFAKSTYSTNRLTKMVSVLSGVFLSMNMAIAQGNTNISGGLIGGVASGDGSVAIGGASQATSENGLAQGAGSLATGGNITKEDFEKELEKANQELAKRKELEAQREALKSQLSSKEKSIENQRVSINGYDTIISKQLSNQSMAESLREQLDAKNKEKGNIESSEAYNSAKDNYNAWQNNIGETTRVEDYVNFPLLINSLDWSRVDGESLTDTLGNRLALKVKDAVPNIYNKYKAIDEAENLGETERYKKMIDGYINDFVKVPRIENFKQKHSVFTSGDRRYGIYKGDSGVPYRYDFNNIDNLPELRNYLPGVTNEVFANIMTNDGVLDFSKLNLRNDNLEKANAIVFNSIAFIKNRNDGFSGFNLDFFKTAIQDGYSSNDGYNHWVIGDNSFARSGGFRREADDGYITYYTKHLFDNTTLIPDIGVLVGTAKKQYDNSLYINAPVFKGVIAKNIDNEQIFHGNVITGQYSKGIIQIMGGDEYQKYLYYKQPLSIKSSEISPYGLSYIKIINDVLVDNKISSQIDFGSAKNNLDNYKSDKEYVLNNFTKENFYKVNDYFTFNTELDDGEYSELFDAYIESNRTALNMVNELISENGFLKLVSDLQEKERSGALSDTEKEEMVSKIKVAKDKFKEKYSSEKIKEIILGVADAHKNVTENIALHFYEFDKVQNTYRARLSAKGVELYNQKFNELVESRKEIANDLYNLTSFNPDDKLIQEIANSAGEVVNAWNAEKAKLASIDKEINNLTEQLNNLGAEGTEIADAQEKKRQAEEEIERLTAEKEAVLNNIGDLDKQIEDLNRSIAEKLNLQRGRASLASGEGSFASGDHSIAIGSESQAVNESAIAVGKDTLANGVGAIAIGKGSTVVGDNSISLGIGNVVKGRASIAIGDPNLVYGDNNLVLGNNNKVGTVDAPKNNNIIIGSEVDASNVENAIVLGNASTAVSNAVSIGTADATKQIKFVKAGADDTDAVNFGQLKEYVANNLNGTATGTPASSEELDGKANVSLNNLDDTGRANIRNIAQAAVTVANGVNTTVTVEDKDNVKTYKVNVSNEAIVSAAKPELDKKANRDGSNLTDEDVAKFSAKLNTGQIEMNNTGLVNGGQVYDYVNRAVSSVGMDIANYAIDQSKAYTDTQIKSLRREAFSGIAASAAIGSIQHIPNRKYSLGAGVGNYKGYSAIAVGFRAQSDNKKHLFGVSAASTTKGDVLTTANYSFGWD